MTALKILPSPIFKNFFYLVVLEGSLLGVLGEVGPLEQLLEAWLSQKLGSMKGTPSLHVTENLGSVLSHRLAPL